MRGALRRPGRVLAVGLVIAVVGWGLDSRTEVVSDIDRLVPQDLAAVQDLKTLQQATGVAGEIDVVIEGRDLTDPAVVKWMRDYQAGVLERYGYSAERGCGRADLCPALSLPDLFRSSQSAGDRERIRALLDAVPPYFSRAVITADRRTANLAFGVRLTSLERQQEIIRDLRERLDPPPGVTARLAGLPVLAAEANATLSDPLRRAATLAVGLLAVLLVLLLVRRRSSGSWRRAWERAWVPVVPIALATGWSALVLWLLRVPLNPLSAMLGALVLAISTEFAVLLSARFEAERAAGHAPAEAIRRTYRSTGAAVLASGATAIAGFAVLALSDVRMLRDFGARHGGRPHGLAARRAGRAARGARARRAPGRRPPRAGAGRRRRREAAGPDRRRAGAGPHRLHLLQLAHHRGARLARRGGRAASCPPSPSRSRCRTSRATPTSPSARATCAATDVLNVCELAERGPVVLAFFAEPIDRCDDQIDVLDRLRSRFPDVQFAAVAIRGDRDELRRARARARLGAAGRPRPATARWPTPTRSRSARRSRSRARGGEVHADDVRQPGRGGS